MKRRISNLLILSFVISALAVGILQEDPAGQLAFVSTRIRTGASDTELSRAVVVVDPGHGGMDGGAQAKDGTSEKEINLAISRKLKQKLKTEGARVILTRSGDEGLYDNHTNGAIRTLKTQDMKRRKQIIDEAEADLAISIHLNSFTRDSSVCGAQVFYPSQGNPSIMEESRKAAKILQDGFNRSLNRQKDREEMGKDDVFLLRDARCPIIIAECGFLSNPEDLRNLKRAEYQEQIVKILQKSVCSYLQQKRPSKAQ